MRQTSTKTDPEKPPLALRGTLGWLRLWFLLRDRVTGEEDKSELSRIHADFLFRFAQSLKP
jgi:hypothetical protein